MSEMDEAIFYHVSRRIDPENSMVRAPSFFEIPTRSARYNSSGRRVEDAVYSEPGKRHERQEPSLRGPVLTVVDRTSIQMKEGVLRIDGSQPDLIDFVRNHERCRGSVANKKSNKAPLFYEYKPKEIFKQKTDMIVEKAALVTKLLSFTDKKDLVAWAGQWGITFTKDQTLQTCREAMILKIEQNPGKFKAAERVSAADSTLEVREWEKFGFIKTWKGGSAKYRWKYGTQYRPEDSDGVILEFDRKEDEYEVLVNYLKENPMLHEELRTEYVRASSLTLK